MSYDMNQVTQAYDTITSKLKTDLDQQFTSGRLKGSDYAATYAQLMATAMQLAFQTPKLEADTNLQKEQTITQQHQQDLTDAQKEVALKQAKSFDQSIKLKLFKNQMDSWAMMFSSGMLEDKPDIIKNDQVSSLYNELNNSVRL